MFKQLVNLQLASNGSADREQFTVSQKGDIGVKIHPKKPHTSECGYTIQFNPEHIVCDEFLIQLSTPRSETINVYIQGSVCVC